MRSLYQIRLLKACTLLLFLVVVINFQGHAQEGFPEPGNNPDQLFYLQRTSNKNTIVYELNMKDRVLNTENPIHVFWIRYEEQGQRQELSYIQKRFAYGVRTKKIKEGHYRLSLNAYESFQMDLKKNATGAYQVHAQANGKNILLQRIFIKIIGGTMLSPDIEYFELKGMHAAGGEPVAEKMKVLKQETGNASAK